MLKSTDVPVTRVLNQTAEHALRALLYLAQRPDVAVAAGEMARAIGAPANYLSKTLQVLARHGLVQGTRGPSGGFKLLGDPAEITIAEIANLFTEQARSPMCLLGDVACSKERSCVAHQQWTDLQMEIGRILSSATLAGLLDANTKTLTMQTLTGAWS